MSPEAWSALLSAAGVIVAISALISESRRNRLSHSIDIISQLDSRFESAEFRELRRTAARHLIQGPSGDLRGEEAVRAVLNFFETVAFLYRKKVLDAETVWHYFGGWLLAYHLASRGQMEREQRKNPNCYRELKPLYDAVYQIEDRERNSVRPSNIVTPEGVENFLHVEASLPRANDARLSATRPE